jgi:NAD(P)-dependent dehydrogenase (short-subunit alcohol dehydrogenase family)
MTDLKNKVAIVTGSARGIGESIALRYAAKGANVVVNYSRDKESADETVREIAALGVRVIGVRANVANLGEIEAMFQEAMATFGKLDIVVANAGIEAIDLPIVDVTEEVYDRLYGVNVKGAFFTMQQAAKTVADTAGSSTSARQPPIFHCLESGFTEAVRPGRGNCRVQRADQSALTGPAGRSQSRHRRCDLHGIHHGGSAAARPPGRGERGRTRRQPHYRLAVTGILS